MTLSHLNYQRILLFAEWNHTYNFRIYMWNIIHQNSLHLGTEYVRIINGVRGHRDLEWPLSAHLLMTLYAAYKVTTLSKSFGKVQVLKFLLLSSNRVFARYVCCIVISPICCIHSCWCKAYLMCIATVIIAEKLRASAQSLVSFAAIFLPFSSSCRVRVCGLLLCLFSHI
jgi:hypothetical protein